MEIEWHGIWLRLWWFYIYVKKIILFNRSIVNEWGSTKACNNHNIWMGSTTRVSLYLQYQYPGWIFQPAVPPAQTPQHATTLCILTIITLVAVTTHFLVIVADNFPTISDLFLVNATGFGLNNTIVISPLYTLHNLT